MRGKLGHAPADDLDARIIPAHAGQTSSLPAATGREPDHPRACGANLSGDGSDTLGDGSSPRMRGKPGALNVPHSSSRIIPAHAGQTRFAVL